MFDQMYITLRQANMLVVGGRGQLGSLIESGQVRTRCRHGATEVCVGDLHVAGVIDNARFEPFPTARRSIASKPSPRFGGQMRVLDLQRDHVRAGVLASHATPHELYTSDLAVDYDAAGG